MDSYLLTLRGVDYTSPAGNGSITGTILPSDGSTVLVKSGGEQIRGWFLRREGDAEIYEIPTGPFKFLGSNMFKKDDVGVLKPYASVYGEMSTEELTWVELLDGNRPMPDGEIFSAYTRDGVLYEMLLIEQQGRRLALRHM